MDNTSNPHFFNCTPYAGHHQFYLEDEEGDADTGVDFWTQEAFARMLATNPGVIGIRTGSYANVPVEIALLEEAPLSDTIADWDHVVEASLVITGEHLLVSSCPTRDIEAEIPIEPGTYRVRVHYGHLESAQATEEGEDGYRILVWPTSWEDVRVLKQWQE